MVSFFSTNNCLSYDPTTKLLQIETLTSHKFFCSKAFMTLSPYGIFVRKLLQLELILALLGSLMFVKGA